MEKFTEKATRKLDIFPESAEKSALIEILNFNLNREY